ncbi:DUF5638 domain-containing protein [Legionella bononiensis]|uniref:DUF5638 domain-containing protein n=1 Tax=Legionella bononiensis TaxID=2793102 RepID=A0ABS1WAE2_9GAMM|nr:DUF5638 domain-containing protein [Legionella bononiensis]MBL7480430.1 hypothetical protein [Legionella bononiensis]MBL7526336.1 hypothetical protein [Legionella bononiensis]MBL7563170.1 hypothetical protein [Legionella bononiensis]
MPYMKNPIDLKTHMDNCTQWLDSMFANFELNQSIEDQLRQVKSFYNRQYNKAEGKSAKIRVIEHYQNLILILTSVSAGELSTEQAFDRIEELTEIRQIEIIAHNLINVCELLFWAAASAVLYISCVSIGIPLLLCEPINGLIVSIGSALLMAASINNAFNCFEEFKTFDRVNKESDREKSLISFFNPPRAGNETQSLNRKNTLDETEINTTILELH